MIQLILLVTLIFLYVYFIYNRYSDGFTLLEDSTFIKTDKDILDKFYSKIYDDLYNTIDIHKKECEYIIPYLNKNSDVLCIDSRTGNLVQLLSKITKIIGLETSSEMVEYSKKKYPELTFKFIYYNPYIFKNKTHIICPLLSIHTKIDIGNFLSICYNWLIHKGYLFVSFMNPIDNISEIINNKPSYKFQHNYKFTIDVQNKPGYSIISENIYNKDNSIKRKNIWNYQSIQLDNLIYEASLRGFKYIKNNNNGIFNMAIFSKST